MDEIEDAEESALTHDDVVALTNLLRGGVLPFWRRLREELVVRGVDPDEAVLAESFEDDVASELGIVVTPERRVHQFRFSYRDDPSRGGNIVEWTDLSANWTTSPYADAVELAFDLLDEERRG